MSDEVKRSVLTSTFGVALATMLSRILGLVRVILMAKFVGGGTIMSAWVWAFTIPNLFRRLLGEGALGTALVPIISHTIEQEGQETARRKLTAILGFLGIILAFICIVIAGGSLLAAQWIHTPRYHLALQILPLLIPYAFFICIIGVITSVLNSIKVFFLPAMGALILNISMITCLLWLGSKTGLSTQDLLRPLSYAVLIAGGIQLLLMILLLKVQGMIPELTISALLDSSALGEIWKLALPGLVGASALQISLLVDRTLAIFLGNYAAPALFYSDRIIYLPIGVFAISLGSVSLANLSRAAAKEKFDEMAETLLLALRHILFICIPIAIFILVFREPIIRLICLRGKFDETCLQETSWAMLFYAFGIPAFAALKISVTGFYSQKNMITPVIISILCIVMNIILNLILMWPLRQGGLALATVLTSFTNNILLLYLLQKKLKTIKYRSLLDTMSMSIAISLLAIAGAYFVFDQVTFENEFTFLLPDLIPMLACGSTFVIVYMLGAFACRSREMGELSGIFKKSSESIKQK